MSFIYLITSPNGKKYVGQSKVTVAKKISWYKQLERHCTTDRKITNAIRKYTWDQMKFEIIESNDAWSQHELDAQEIYWIAFHNSVVEGYNMTPGGVGIDSETARLNALNHHATMTPDKKISRSNNCSTGQKERFAANPESDETKKKKSDAHKGQYLIESPDGRTWTTSLGLKEFASTFADEIQISYWSLFNAYRNNYKNHVVVRHYKNQNKWKVTRLDE